MSEIYNVKKNLEKIIVNFISTEIEWIPLNSVEISKQICILLQTMGINQNSLPELF